LIEHDLADRVGVLRNECTLGAFVIQQLGLMGEDRSFHRLWTDPAHLGGGAIEPKRVNASTTSRFFLADNIVNQPHGCVIGN